MVGVAGMVAVHGAGAVAGRWDGADVDARRAFGGRDAAKLKFREEHW